MANEPEETDMSMIRYSPFDDLFRTFANFGEPVGRGEYLPAVHIVELERAYQIDVDLPGVSREDTHVAVNDGILTVSGERKAADPEGARVHRSERTLGKFSRTFRLPENADEAQISARSENGVLRLTIAKQVKAVPRRIEVEVH
jgi:HSP20 family protein